MPCYLIAEVKVTDDGWIPDYAARVHDIVARHGGRYLSRSGRIEALEGEAPDASLVALIEFPSLRWLQSSCCRFFRSSCIGMKASISYARQG